MLVVSPHPDHLTLVDGRVREFSDRAVGDLFLKRLDFCWDDQGLVFGDLAPNEHLPLVVEAYAALVAFNFLDVLQRRNLDGLQVALLAITQPQLAKAVGSCCVDLSLLREEE